MLSLEAITAAISQSHWNKMLRHQGENWGEDNNHVMVAPNTESRTSWQPSNTTSRTGRGLEVFIFSRRQR